MPSTATIAACAVRSFPSARYLPASSASAGNIGRTYPGSFELDAEKNASTTSAQRASQNAASNEGARLAMPRHQPTAAGSSSGASPPATIGRKNHGGAA